MNTFALNGFRYSKDTRCTKTETFRCLGRTNKIRGYCKGVLRKVNGIYVIKTPHSCTPKKHIENDIAAQEKMIDRALNTRDTVREIFDGVDLEFSNQNKKITLEWKRMKQILLRKRRKAGFTRPNNLEELAERISNDPNFKHIFKGVVKDGVDTALLFSTDELIKELNEQTELYMDGTFEVCPQLAKIAQLYTIVMRVNDKSVGAVFILMTRRTKALYKQVFLKLQELCPNLKNGLQDAMLDFETAVRTAIKELFPNCKVHGCWFHSKKAMKKRWKKLGLKKAPPTALNLACCLALAPADKFFEGLDVIKAEIKEYAAVYRKRLNAFAKYLKTYWGKLNEVVCVGHLPHRTNNLCESLNSRLKSKLGGSHPQIWQFVDNLKKLFAVEEKRLNDLHTGKFIGKPMREKDKRRDRVIFKARKDLENGGDLKHFLETCIIV